MVDRRLLPFCCRCVNSVYPAFPGEPAPLVSMRALRPKLFEMKRPPLSPLSAAPVEGEGGGVEAEGAMVGNGVEVGGVATSQDPSRP